MLQLCYKISYEAPPGLKRKFQRTHQALDAGSSPLGRSFAFILAYFHALLQQRRAFIPQGWSKSYEFSLADAKVSLTLIKGLLTDEASFNFQELYGLLMDGVYGGRVDNPTDSKVLKAYLKRYFNQSTLFEGGQIGCGGPVPKNQKELNAFLSRMPEMEAPDAFGLSNCLNNLVQRTEAKSILLSLRSMSAQATDSVSKAASAADLLQELTPLFNSWAQICKRVGEAGFPKPAELGQMAVATADPIEYFIYFETQTALELLSFISIELLALEDVLKGKGLSSTKTKQLLDCLLTSQVPKEWESFYEGPASPSEWLRTFGAKLCDLRDWLDKAKGPKLGAEYDLSEIFHPTVFLNAFRQTVGRGTVPLDRLYTVATFESDKSSTKALKLKGLLLQGCGLSGHLIGPGLKEEESIELPTLYLNFMPNCPPLYPNVEDFLLFESLTRDKVVISLPLGIVGDLQDKIIAGTALIIKNS